MMFSCIFVASKIFALLSLLLDSNNFYYFVLIFLLRMVDLDYFIILNHIAIGAVKKQNVNNK